MDNYLIPANANRGKLILGIFRGFDLGLFLVGVFATLILMLTIDISNIWIGILAVLPALICGFLIIPIPYYHNILVFFREMIIYINSQKIYHWRGWCYKNGDK